MFRKLRRTTSLGLAVVILLMSFTPMRAMAAVPYENNSYKTSDTVYRAVARDVSAQLKGRLTEYNIPVNNDTLIEIVNKGSSGGSVLYATSIDGALIHQSVLTAYDENGERVSFTEANLTDDLEGGSLTINPFRDSFKVVFTITFYIYNDGLILNAYVQPQMAMFIYYDDADIYSISQFTMNYNCIGIEGYYDGVNFTAISGPLDGYRYTITVSRNNPNRRTYYSQTDPISSNKAVYIYSGPGGVNEVEFEIFGTRKATGASVHVYGAEEVALPNTGYQ